MHKSKLRANIASSGSWSIAPTDETKKGFFMEFEIKPWVENITADDMPNDDLRFIAEKAGLKSALALIFFTPGLNVSIPKTAFKQLKDKYILNNYRGDKYSMNELSVKCSVSQRYIYRLIKDNIKSPSINP